MNQANHTILPLSGNSPGHQAYRTALYGLIPVAGLYFGSLAIYRGIRAWRAARRDPDQEGLAQAMAGVFLGIGEILTNGIGLLLIGIGLASLGG